MRLSEHIGEMLELLDKHGDLEMVRILQDRAPEWRGPVVELAGVGIWTTEPDGEPVFRVEPAWSDEGDAEQVIAWA